MENELDFSDIFEIGEDTTPEEDNEVTASAETDSEADESEEQPETEPEGTPQPEEDAQEPAEDTIPFKHNHQETPLSKAAVDSLGKSLNMDSGAVVATLQKGANYDAVRSRLDRFNGLDPLADHVAAYAQQSGKSIPESVEAMQKAVDFARYHETLTRIKSENPGLNEAAVQAIANAELKNVRANTAQEQMRRATEEQNRAIEPWKQFFTNHKEFTADNLPEDIVNGVGGGMSPEEAYYSYQNKQLIEKNKQLETKLTSTVKAKVNQHKSTGSLLDQAGDVKTDAFEEGFDSVFD